MPNAADKTAVMTENLRDIGLNDEMTAKCLILIEEKRYKELEKLLKAYRKSLLESVHKYNDRIDCLDFLTYKLRKNGGI
ncbi:hypothetical protein [Ruminococcus sp.]|uniref:hypothetical protein n=1 Tax=Ruminococcus sp. TaxID=41978 RepID=UPI002587980C|nr:hypothetical protein [Ruminococcus sp.]MCR5020795.1 hypothetical protein [Ruminococcus sp.]